MSSNSPRSPQERQQTDESLDVERKKSDDEIRTRDARIELRSDEVVRKARGRADGVLGHARDRADETLMREGSTGAQQAAVVKERATEDAVVEQERSTADEELVAERQERKRALASLLRIERDQTDERLLIERARGDKEVTGRDDFMAMVSHDVRTLLGGIALTAELQIKNAGDDAVGQRNRKSAEKIQRFAAGIKRLVGDLVDVASIEAGRFSIAPNHDDLTALVHESIEAFHFSAEEKKITLTGTVAEGAKTLPFDHDRILQVLANFLSNALKFTPEGGTVTIRVERSGAEVQFLVSDSGPGIAQNHLGAIFERFWQATEGDTRGLGLGLFISKCIVEAHGGRVWAQSVIGKGSTVAFALPAAP